jgi:hypothetical protein
LCQVISGSFCRCEFVAGSIFKLDNRVQQVDECVANIAENMRFLAYSCKFDDATAMHNYLGNVFPRNLRDESIKIIVIP